MIHRSLTTTAIIIAVCGAATGCLEKQKDQNDAGTNTNADARVDAAPMPDAAPSVCDRDDLVEQLACGTGQRCTLLSSTEIGCNEAGVAPAYDTCDSTALPDSYCGLGTLCSDLHNPGSPECLPVCLEKFDDCALGGKCVLDSVYDGVMLCTTGTDCDPVGNVGGPVCTSGGGCYMSYGGETYCIESTGSARQLGETCVDLECDTGLVCADTGDGDRCQKLCYPPQETTDDPRGIGPYPCAATETCVPAMLFFGICFQQ